MNIEHLIKEKKGTIVDVRTREEFMGGHVTGSVNIPLHDIPNHMDEIKSMNLPLVLCCASGGRSGQAQRYLSQQGIDCMNGGSWLDVNYYHAQTV